MDPERVELSTGKVYAEGVIEWLWTRQEKLSTMTVIVPTAQSGRRLRQGLAERGATLSPAVMTVGALLQIEGVAVEALEVLAWTEVLEGVDDWSRFEQIFPESPVEEEGGWALGLAKTFYQLRGQLQDGGLMIGDVSRLIPSIERERWEQLAELEQRVERLLGEWDFRSKSAVLSSGELPVPRGEVVIAGVLDLPAVVAESLGGSQSGVTILLPPGREDDFDSWGRPLGSWSEKMIGWPEVGSVTLTGDPKQQAEVALKKVAEEGRSSREVAVGTGDEEVSPEFLRTFGQAGWVVYDPAATLPSLLVGWMKGWRQFMKNPGIKEAMDVLSFRQSRDLFRGSRAAQVRALSVTREAFLSRDLEDLKRVGDSLGERLEGEIRESTENRLRIQLEEVKLAQVALRNLMALRQRFLRDGFHAVMRSLHLKLDPEGEEGLEGWLERTGRSAEKVDRPATFWIDLLVDHLPSRAEVAPDDRVLDIQGWLELLHEPAPHLVLSGFNEGRIPARVESNTWLPEKAREAIGLPGDRERTARDAYLLNALIEMRKQGGRVDLIVGKFSAGGDALMPSRVLLRDEGKALATKVKLLFDEVEPAETGVAWELEEEWKWRPRKELPRERLPVTGFTRYLACPFRFYLERVLRMSEPEPERVEWNARDYGSVLHEVLEAWGREVGVRDSSDAEEIEAWTQSALDRGVAAQFGKELPLAVALQVESMRLRLGWFAKEQARSRAEGWRVVEVEKDFELEIEGFVVTGQIDRIDRHEESGELRVLDYKTSKEAKKVEGEHLRLFRDQVPAHLETAEAMAPNGKHWTNLQVPIYVAALEGVSQAGYFAIGQDETNVRIERWEGFSEEDRDSAMDCAKWVIGQVKAGVFWPPAEKVKYDGFEKMAYGRSLTESFQREGVQA